MSEHCRLSCRAGYRVKKHNWKQKLQLPTPPYPRLQQRLLRLQPAQLPAHRKLQG